MTLTKIAKIRTLIERGEPAEIVALGLRCSVEDVHKAVSDTAQFKAARRKKIVIRHRFMYGTDPWSAHDNEPE